MVDIVQTSRIVQAICNCDTPARPVILPARCSECSAMLVAVGTPVWHTVTTAVPVERGSQAVLQLRVNGDAVAW